MAYEMLPLQLALPSFDEQRHQQHHQQPDTDGDQQDEYFTPCTSPVPPVSSNRSRTAPAAAAAPSVAALVAAAAAAVNADTDTFRNAYEEGHYAKFTPIYGDEENTVLPGAIQEAFKHARYNRSVELEELLSAGLPADVRDVHGNTLLCVACQNGNRRAAKATLRHGANINAQNYRGQTPLHFCYAFGYFETLGTYLLSKGADPSITNRAGLDCTEGLASNKRPPMF